MNLEGRKPLLVVDIQCSRLIEPIKSSLIVKGLWTFESFDLRSTRAFHEGCSCPHHGTNECTCELVVLLVYHAVGEPISMVLDGRDDQTFVFVTGEGKDAIPASAVEIIENSIRKAVYTLQNQDIWVDV